MNKRLANAEVKPQAQAHLTGECWIVQMDGLKACSTCTYQASVECGGIHIRQTGRNSKGYAVPLKASSTHV